MSLVLIVADRHGDKQVAISRGLELAEKMGWGAQIVGFAYEDLARLSLDKSLDKQQLKKRLLQKRRADVEADVDKHKRNVRTAVTIVWQQHIHVWLDRQCDRKDYAAVIKTGHRSETFLYTPTDWHLFRRCPAPVLIVAEKKWRATKPVVAAVDLSDDSRTNRQLNDKIIETAKQFAEALDTKLHVVHALHIPALLTELDLVDEYTHIKEMKAELEPRVAQMAKVHGLPRSSFKLKQGPVHKVLCSESARLKAQLVVMGTVGRRGVKSHIMGNTSERVLGMLRTDVLTLKP